MANKQYVVPIEIVPSTGGGGGTGTVTSVGTAGIATGGPITTTGTVTVAGSGTTKTAATSDPNLATAPSGDVVTTDGSGNVQDSGTLLSSLAPLASPAFTGTPTAPTAVTADNTTKLATTAFVKAQGYGTGSVTSVATSGIATGGPITTTGTISVAGSGNTTTAATAAANLAGATAGNVVSTDGSGNVQSSGTLLSSLAPLASPTFTGTVTIPTAAITTASGNPNFSGTPTFANPVALGSSTATTQTGGTNNTTLATTAFVQAAIGASGAVAWNNIGNATGNLSLANGTNTTTFNQTNNTIWQWANTTVATASSTNATPQIQIAANYWTGAASAQDTWTISSSLAAGSNGRSNLVIAHAGSSTTPVISFPNSSLTIVGFTASGQIGGGRAGIVSSPAVLFTGAPFSGGNGTTTQPFFYFNSGASAPTTWNTSGTIEGINAVSGFAGNFTDFRINGGASLISISSAGIVTNYNGIATVRNGVSANYASSDLTAQTAAIAATTLLSAPYTGVYEISWSADITTASDTSSVLGGANGFQVIYTSPTDSVVKTTVAGASVTSSANTTGTAVGGTITIFAKTGTNIQFSYGYTNVSSVTAMAFELHITVRGL